MGSNHSFTFESYSVCIRLPPPEHANRDEIYDQVAHISSRRADTNKPLSFRIEKVDVVINLPKTLSIPDEALVNPPNQFQHFSEEQQVFIEDACKTHYEIAKRAFVYWLEIIRWASGFALIGQPDISDIKSGWATHIMDVSTGHMVWGGTIIDVISKDSEVNIDHWSKAEEYLKNGSILPMYHRFLHDAENSMRNGFYEKAILELAMACEIYIRYSVFEFIPDNTPQAFVTYLEEANINKYSSSFFKNLVPTANKIKYKKTTVEISSLMSKRNSYVHMGKMEGADVGHCRRYISALKVLFEITLSRPS